MKRFYKGAAEFLKTIYVQVGNIDNDSRSVIHSIFKTIELFQNLEGASDN